MNTTLDMGFILWICDLTSAGAVCASLGSSDHCVPTLRRSLDDTGLSSHICQTIKDNIKVLRLIAWLFGFIGKFSAILQQQVLGIQKNSVKT